MKILFLESIHEKTRAWLKDQTDIEIEYYSTDNSIDYSSINAIVTRGIGIINAELVEKCPNLIVVARCGVGLDNIDTKFCNAHNIKVVYAPGSNAQTTAEHTMALMINLQRNVYQAISAVKEGNWLYRNKHQSDELYGKTLGVIGYGNIGKKVALMAEAFGMKIVYWSKTQKDTNHDYLPFEQVLERADILSIHLPLNDETEYLFNEAAIALCKKGVLIVNTARAKIFDRVALLAALNTGQIGGYAADVPMSPIPQKGDELNEHARTLITPHVSSLTDATYYKMCQFTLENVVNILKGNPYDENSIF